ncbi:carboxylesterase/lipase family protein [Actinoallomurus spadix]|uniref:Para-nitrobenzyl esterase n=1 Tax=Actinoallomurus spadix TaxID=79912 RepID=A0ABN0VZ70_9ACTN|nr:carboxylesterase/lipase family protein [Actinoallomurus spadix]MCO5988073.1 carboxylesterase/lipase family protein [Actinoallomurus spadix]
MLKRTFAALAFAGAAVAMSSCASPVTTASAGSRTGCATTTSLGAVAGTVREGLCVFRGIRYAEPPTGALRFRPPRPVGRWRGTLKATDDKAVCPQDRDAMSEDYPDGRALFTDEDCLRLNVWTPAPDHRRRPVIVFVHGGAARYGTANEPRYDGARLAARGDAVVVSINYRLGVLGWSELGGLDPAYKGSGNNGLRDQITALRWVHDHIADFGGDPADVTAVGESAGAFSLSAMLATDHPERLFRRVVLESGSGALVHTAAYEREVAAQLPVKSVAELRGMSTKQILDLQNKVIDQDAPGIIGATYFAPYIDGALVRDSVVTRVARGNARGVDLLIGTNRDEMNFFGQLGPEAMTAIGQQYDAVFFPHALAARRERMVAAYRRGRSATEAALAMFTDQGMRVPATRLAQAQSRWRPTYLYEFGWRPTKEYGAVHTLELPFVFGTFRFTGILGGEEAFNADRARLTTLSDQMIDAWTSFARTGDPNARRTVERPAWPAYRAPRRATMMWNVGAKVADDPRGRERALWNGYPFTAFGLPA